LFYTAIRALPATTAASISGKEQQWNSSHHVVGLRRGQMEMLPKMNAVQSVSTALHI
jgi:hypothetical protein